ncbi:hypothetical protein [Snodgrassella communis]|uniref:hypothetical protein n=1 Tax=Snodgrassella communis TaxID=2946699 RepID=UPI000C1ECA1C|nr:hypothetical protein [Snodgrassella communis]
MPAIFLYQCHLNTDFSLQPNHQIVPRRAGDIASCYANPERAVQELGWQARSLFILVLCRFRLPATLRFAGSLLICVRRKHNFP